MQVESVWWPRLRWRMRGATQWPAFALLTAIDAGVLLVLPFYGQGPDGLGAVLLAGFLNLAVVAILAPLAGWLLRRRRPDLPRLVANDYAGTWLLGLATAGLIAAGLAHRPALRGREDALRSVAAAMRRYVVRQAPRYRDHLGALDAIRIDTDQYRACIPRDAPGRALCLYVRTSQQPAGFTVDPDQTPNARLRIP